MYGSAKPAPPPHDVDEKPRPGGFSAFRISHHNGARVVSQKFGYKYKTHNTLSQRCAFWITHGECCESPISLGPTARNPNRTRLKDAIKLRKRSRVELLQRAVATFVRPSVDLATCMSTVPSAVSACCVVRVLRSTDHAYALRVARTTRQKWHVRGGPHDRRGARAHSALSASLLLPA